MFDYLPLFLLAMSSLLPLVNPVGTALIIAPYFNKLNFQERKQCSLQIVFYSFLLGISALLLGSWCLKFMGISIAATQVAGGLLIAKMGLSLLNPVQQESGLVSDTTKGLEGETFYPLAFPLTFGPGCISAIITLSAHAHTESFGETWARLGVVAFALLFVCCITYFTFVYSPLVLKRIGSSGSLALNRLLAFLVFCIGIQMIATGLMHLFPRLLNG